MKKKVKRNKQKKKSRNKEQKIKEENMERGVGRIGEVGG